MRISLRDRPFRVKDNLTHLGILLDRIENVKSLRPLAGQAIAIDKTLVGIDPEKFAASLEKFQELLEKAEGFTASDLLDLPSFVEKLRRDDVPGFLHSPVATVQWEGLLWPKKDILPGATVVLGDMMSGKTYYLRKSANVDFLIRYGEPFEDVDLDPRVIGVSSVNEVLEVSLILAAAGFRVGIDSLRHLVYNLTGAAMEGGMSASLFDVITSLNNIFAAYGVNVMVGINPMLSEPDKAERLFRRIGASCVGVIWLDNREIRGSTFRMIDGRVLNGAEATPEPREDDISTGYFINMNRLDDQTVRDGINAVYNTVVPGVDDDERDPTPRILPHLNL